MHQGIDFSGIVVADKLRELHGQRVQAELGGALVTPRRHVIRKGWNQLVRIAHVGTLRVRVSPAPAPAPPTTAAAFTP